MTKPETTLKPRVIKEDVRTNKITTTTTPVTTSTTTTTSSPDVKILLTTLTESRETQTARKMLTNPYTEPRG